MTVGNVSGQVVGLWEECRCEREVWLSLISLAHTEHIACQNALGWGSTGVTAVCKLPLCSKIHLTTVKIIECYILDFKMCACE